MQPFFDDWIYMPSLLKYRLLSVIKLSLFVVTKKIWSRFAYMHWQSRGLLDSRGSAARQRCDSQGYAWQWREAIGKHNLLMISHGRDPVRVPWLKWFCFQIFSQTVEASFREQFFWLQNLRYHRNPGEIQTEWYDPLSIDQGFADSEAQGPRWDSTTFIKIASFCRNDDKKSHYHIGTETGANSKSVHNNGSMAQMFCFVMFVFHMYPYVANTWHSSIFSAAPALGLPCEMRLQRILWRQHSPSPGLGKMGEQLQHLLCTEHSLWVREQNAGRYKACCFFNVSRLT